VICLNDAAFLTYLPISSNSKLSVYDIAIS